MLCPRNLLKASLLIGALFSAASLRAHEFTAGTLMIDHPWTRATPTGASTAAGYLKITNNGKEADTFIGGSVEGIGKVEVHEMSMDNNVMKMRHLEGGLEIKPGATVELKPGGYHLMMIGLKNGIKKGDMIKGTLSFAKAGAVAVEFEVEAMGASSVGHGHKH